MAGRVARRASSDPNAPEDIRDAIWRLKRERVVATAVDLFYHHGYARTTLEQVAAAMHVTKPFIYAHFKSKSDLLAEICMRGTRVSHESLLRAIAQPGTPADKLRTIVRDFMLSVLNHQAHAVIYSREEKELMPEDREAINRVRREFDHRLVAVLQEGVAQGAFTLEDVPLTALAIIGSVGWSQMWFRSNGRLTKEDSAERMASLALTMVGANTRLLTEEVRKLATYAGLPSEASAKEGEGCVITEAQVIELTPNQAEGDFFESADRFFAGDLPGTLHALEKHFFAGGDARPVLSSLQNRNRILIQARVLIDAGDLRMPGPYGFDKAAWARAQSTYARHFGGDAEKSSYNLFTQNQWYAGKLVSSGRLPSLRRLIDNQQEFIAAFEEIIRRPDEQETVLRDMAVRCLT